MAKETGRYFIAVPLPGQVKQRIAEVLAEAKRELVFQKWVHPADLHITLFFLGETPERKLDSIKDALLQSAAGTEPFQLRIEDLGTFGSPSSPRVLWAGIKGDLEPLRALQHKVSNAMSKLMIQPEDRPYRPHLTVARRFKGQPGPVQEAVKRAPAPSGELYAWTVEEIVLYKTHMGQEPMYEQAAVFRFQLKKGPVPQSD